MEKSFQSWRLSHVDRCLYDPMSQCLWSSMPLVDRKSRKWEVPKYVEQANSSKALFRWVIPEPIAKCVLSTTPSKHRMQNRNRKYVLERGNYQADRSYEQTGHSSSKLFSHSLQLFHVMVSWKSRSVKRIMASQAEVFLRGTQQQNHAFIWKLSVHPSGIWTQNVKPCDALSSIVSVSNQVDNIYRTSQARENSRCLSS